MPSGLRKSRQAVQRQVGSHQDVKMSRTNRSTNLPTYSVFHHIWTLARKWRHFVFPKRFLCFRPSLHLAYTHRRKVE